MTFLWAWAKIYTISCSMASYISAIDCEVLLKTLAFKFPQRKWSEGFRPVLCGSHSKSALRLMTLLLKLILRQSKAIMGV